MSGPAEPESADPSVTPCSDVCRDVARAVDRLVLLEGRLWTDQVRRAARQPPPSQPPPSRATADVAAAMAAWRAEVDPHDGGLFATRLARDGLTPDTARTVFDPPHAAALAEPSWWAAYRRLVEALQQAEGPSVDAEVDADEGLRATPFAHLLAPIAATEMARLEATVAEALHPHLRRDLRRILVSRLSNVAAATLSEVMWRDVPFGARVLARFGVADQEPPRERYLAFCDHHRRTGLVEVFCDYPVLGRYLATVIDQWHRSSMAMLARLANDRQALAARFGLPSDEPVTGVSAAAGDRHNDGMAVTLVRFGDATIVYKPRSVHLEGLYAEVAQAVSAQLDGAALRAPAVMRRTDEVGDYGYVEFVEGHPCEPSRLAAFYRNAGRLLAVLNALMATDCHHENLIAAGDQLVLIDAETLLVGTPSDGTGPSTRVESADAPEPGSILRVGMLPTWVWLDGRRLAIDVSALGVPPIGLLGGSAWRAINTDAMTTAPASVPVARPTSLPGRQGEPNPVGDHVDDLVAGFTEAYRVLVDGRETWLAELLMQVASAHNRAVLRPTYVYGSLLASLTAPEALRSMAAGAMVCERLTRGHLDAAAASTWPLVAAEQEALQRLDIPFFTWPLTGGATRWHGGEVNGWPAINQMAQVRASLRGLDDADLRTQVALIRTSIRASAMRIGQVSASEGGRRASTDRTAVGPCPTPGELARRCFETTAAAAFSDRGSANWMGLSVLPDGVHANVAPIGAGLYDGRMGLAVSMQLWAQADPSCADQAMGLSSQVLAPVLEAIADVDGVRRLMLMSGSGIAGLGGLLRGLAFLRDCGAERDCGVDLEAVADAHGSILTFLTPSRVTADHGLDLMAGPAGLVAPLVRTLTDQAHAGVSRQHLLDLIAASARVLVERQEAASGGWLTMRDAPALTGLAHGASGMALALIEAAVALRDTSLLPPALRGLGYEADLFDADAGNWPDLRPDVSAPSADRGSTPGFMLGWCAGAPGIALVRHRLLQLLPDHAHASQWRAELYRAADTTASAPALTRDHLCCGNLGRVIILRTLADQLGDTRWDDDVARLVEGVRVAAGTGLPKSMLGKTIPDLPEPGLFTGVPGAGVALLGDVSWVPRLLL